MNEQICYEMNIVDDYSNLEELDFFILASGSENRAYEIIKKFNSKKVSIEKVLVINFIERVNGITEQDSLFSYKNFTFLSTTEIKCNIREPSTCLNELLDQSFKSNSKIGIDISCLTKPYIYYLIQFLKKRCQISTLTVFYTEPESYLFPNGLYKEFRTNTGPLTIFEIPGYPGIRSGESKRVLVLLLGFDGDISNEINEDVSPSETIIINGFPAYAPKFKDISLIVNEKLVSDPNINLKYSRANNPFDTYNILQEIKKKYKETFLNIASLGTKPMALGACLFALHNPEVRVIYPFPETYTRKYSNNSWKSWKYSLLLD